MMFTDNFANLTNRKTVVNIWFAKIKNSLIFVSDINKRHAFQNISLGRTSLSANNNSYQEIGRF